ncbi:hypothetical protein D3C83_228400 [compost metagenome]
MALLFDRVIQIDHRLVRQPEGGPIQDITQMGMRFENVGADDRRRVVRRKEAAVVLEDAQRVSP